MKTLTSIPEMSYPQETAAPVRGCLTGRALGKNNPVAKLIDLVGPDEVYLRMRAVARRVRSPGCSDRTMAQLLRLIYREVCGLAPERLLPEEDDDG